MAQPALSACPQGMRVDGSNADSTRHSLQVMEKGFSAGERTRFEAAIQRIRLYNPNAGYDSRLKGPDALVDDEILGRRIGGMTCDEIEKFAKL
jgi:hypothetical protein